MTDEKNRISRVTRSKEEARSTYNRISRWYDFLAGSEKTYRELGLQMLGASSGEVVLEIGFGTGKGILSLAQSVGRSGKVYGIDISDSMVAIAQSRVRRAGLEGRVNLRRGDALHLPFREAFFHAAFACFTLELFDTPEIPYVLGECRRVLLNGGRLGVVAMALPERPNVTSGLYALAHRAFPAYIDCRPILVRKTIEDSGFRIVEVARKSMWGLPVEIVFAAKPAGLRRPSASPV